MKRAAILYHSSHHHNTEQLLQAIARQYPLTLIPLPAAAPPPRLDDYDVIGFASGIYHGDVHTDVYSAANELTSILDGKTVCLLLTSGSGNAKYGARLRALLEEQGAVFAGTYHCRGFDTFGPFKLIGGTAKGHPTADEVAGAVAFFGRILAGN